MGQAGEVRSLQGRLRRDTRLCAGMEGADVGGDSGGEAFEGVAAFEDGKQAALGMFGGDFEGEFGERGEVGVGEPEAAEGVADAGVEACGEQDERGLEGFGGGEEAFPEGPEDFVVARAGGKRAVHDASLALALAGFLLGAGAGVPGVLVGGEEQDAAVGIEGVLGAVAVVDVPIDDEDAVGSVFALRVAGGEGDVVEEAEAHAGVGGGVGAGGADGAEGAAGGGGEERIDRVEDSTGGFESDIEGTGGVGDIAGGEIAHGIGMRGEGGDFGADGLDVGGSVDEGEFVVIGRAGLNAGGAFKEVRAFEGTGEGVVAGGTFGVSLAGQVVLVEGIQQNGEGHVEMLARGGPFVAARDEALGLGRTAVATGVTIAATREDDDLFVEGGGDGVGGFGQGGGQLFGFEAHAEGTFDAADFVALGADVERRGDATESGAAGAADAVDEVFGRLGQIEVHDVGDVVDVDAAGGDVTDSSSS